LRYIDDVSEVGEEEEGEKVQKVVMQTAE